MTSLGTRALRDLAEGHEYESVDSLIRAIKDPGEQISRNEVTIALHSLNRDGKVYLREGRNGDMTFIKATRRGYADQGQPIHPGSAQVGTRGANHLPGRAGDGTDFRNHFSHAEGGEITRTMTKPEDSRMDRMRAGDGSVTARAVEAYDPNRARELLPYVVANPGSSYTALEIAAGVGKNRIILWVRKSEQMGWIRIEGKGTGQGNNGGKRKVYITDDGRRAIGLRTEDHKMNGDHIGDVEAERIARTVPTAVIPRARTSETIDRDPLAQYPLTRDAIDEYDVKYGPIKAAAAILRNSGQSDLADLVEQEANIQYTPIMAEAMAMGRLLREWRDRR